MKKLYIIIMVLLSLSCLCVQGQDKAARRSRHKADTTLVARKHATGSDSLKIKVDTLYTDEYLDTVNIRKRALINDYTMLGVQYGASMNRVSFNPTKEQSALMTFNNFGILFTKYEKLFRYMPYFGYQIGLFYGHDGYKFEPNDEGICSSVDGATKAIYEYIEVPAMAHLHIDAGQYFKMMANIGIYGSYKLSVKRYGDVPEEYVNKFYPYDKRFEYGIRGGGGIALMFSPIELHIGVSIKYAFSSLYEPDYASQYYYRYASPFDLMFTFGVHYRLTKRMGKTKGQLRKEAKNLVFNPEPTE